MLSSIYGKEYSTSPAYSNISSITFAGTVVGQLFFGWTSDHYSRKNSLLASTIIVIVFAALAAGSYGAHDSISGLLAALTAYRFLLGIGIGGEYPAGSVACAESTGELESGTRNRWFVMFTNVQIDFGFVVGAIVPMIVVLITSENHLRAAWRICLGLGVIPPLSLLYLRLKLEEPESYKRGTLAHTRTPWLLVIKFYWFRLAVVSLIWFCYDFTVRVLPYSIPSCPPRRTPRSPTLVFRLSHFPTLFRTTNGLPNTDFYRAMPLESTVVQSLATYSGRIPSSGSISVGTR